MIDWEERVKKLEEKNRILQETLDTVKKMQLSSEMARYIRSQETVLKLVDLVNLVSEEPEIALSDRRALLHTELTKKTQIDTEIETSVLRAKKLTEQYACDPKMFGFELESGVIREYGRPDKQISAMSDYIGKGVRITSYHGKHKNVIIIPDEIEGYPVVSIGKAVFEKMSITDIVLPNTLRAIYDEAFNSCQLLQGIDFPAGLVYLGENCFYGCGLKSITIPGTIEEIPTFAFAYCDKLTSVTLNEGLKIIGNNAFMNCPIDHIKLPESIETLKGNCLSNTKFYHIILPKGTKTVHPVAFANTANASALNNMVCVFLGKDTSITPSEQFQGLRGVRMIYCWPGSAIEKHAQENLIITKSLAELEEKQ